MGNILCSGYCGGSRWLEASEPLASSESFPSLSLPTSLSTRNSWPNQLWKSCDNWTWRCSPVSLELGKLRQAGFRVHAILHYVVRYSLRQDRSLQGHMLTEKWRSCLLSERFQCGKELRHSRGKLGNPSAHQDTGQSTQRRHKAENAACLWSQGCEAGGPGSKAIPNHVVGSRPFWAIWNPVEEGEKEGVKQLAKERKRFVF